MDDQEFARQAEEIQERFNVQLDADEVLLQVHLRHWIVFGRRVWWLLLLLIVVIVGWALWAHYLGTGAWQPSAWLLAPVTLLLLIMVAYFYIDWRNDALIMTDQRLLHVEKVILIFASRYEIPLANVQNVRSSTPGLLPRLLGYGDIEVESAARGLDLVFGPVPRPRETANQIQSRVNAILQATSAQLMRDTLLHRLDPARHPEPEIPGISAVEEASIKPRRQSHYFIPPSPQIAGDRITWYKHRFFLFLRLFWPTLFLLVLLIGGIALLRRLEVGALGWLAWAAAVVLALGWLVVQYQLWLGDIYVLTQDTVIDIRRTPFGLFGEARRTTNLERIQNTNYEKPGLLATLLNYGNVLIQTAGEEDFTFDLVPHPEEVQAEINRRRRLHKERGEQRRREEIADWLVAYRDVMNPPSEESP